MLILLRFWPSSRDRRAVLWRQLRARRRSFDPRAARDHRDDPARQVPEAVERAAMAGRRTVRPTRDSTALFLDMLAAERGAGANTLVAYRRDLEDLAALSSRAAAWLRRARAPMTLRGYLADLDDRGFGASACARNCRRCASCTASCFARACASDDPPRSCRRSEARARLPKVLSIAEVERLIVDGEMQCGACRPERPRGASARCASMPARAALRDRLARVANSLRCRRRRRGATRA